MNLRIVTGKDLDAIAEISHSLRSISASLSMINQTLRDLEDSTKDLVQKCSKADEDGDYRGGL